MIVERLGRHIGLKRFIVVREGREFEGHGSTPPDQRWGKSAES
jgi:hypothetical protein